MKPFTNAEVLTHERLNEVVKEIETRMSSADLIRMYESLMKRLYNKKLNKYEQGRVKEIEYIISYLKAGEIANEFKK